MKSLKLTSSTSPTQKLLVKEAKQTRKLAFSVLRKLPKSVRPLITIIFKSSVPRTKHGKFLADTRNELSRIRVCLHEVNTFLDNTERQHFMNMTESQLETLPFGNVDWKPYSELVITPEMENYTMLLWVEQKKLCRLHVPRVITADIVGGKVKICYSHKLTDRDWSLSKITHYTWLNEPE